MMLTLGWKEMREHRAIWLTMVVLTGLLGPGLGELVASGNNMTGRGVTHLAILGLAATYGIVCGAMMFAGEHENGTMTFLDIFLGRRTLLWFAKFAIGIPMVLLQGVAVAGVLYFLKQTPPSWAWGILGVGQQVVGVAARREPGLELWFAILPVITLEAYAWGLMGSALSRRVLVGAAIAACTVAPVWLIAVHTPAPVFVGVRLVAMFVVLVISQVSFQASLGDNRLGPPPAPEERPVDRRRRMLRRLEEFEREREFEPQWGERPAPKPLPALVEVVEGNGEPRPVPPPLPRIRQELEYPQPRGAAAVLWWLTIHQAWAVFMVLAVAAFFLGFFLPVYGQVMWPLTTLLIGIACGTSTFGAEQRDQSYQFLSCQHLPLQRLWRFKTMFWFSIAVLLAVVFTLGSLLYATGRNLAEPREAAGRHWFDFGTLHQLMGTTLFFSVWLVYGFCAGQLFVWLCRKLLLALLLSALAALGAVGLWMPSLLTGGMGGWQMWAAPLACSVAAVLLMRAWASGRIKERRPLTGVIGLAGVLLAWAGLHFLYRIWEIPNVSAPLDRVAFRASFPAGKTNEAAQKLQEAIAAIDPARPDWLKDDPLGDRLREAERLPLPMVEQPPAEGQAPLLPHLPSYRELANHLVRRAEKRAAAREFTHAFDNIRHILLISRALRHKAPLEAYVTGVAVEGLALDALDRWLLFCAEDAKLLRQALEDLSNHAAETPPFADTVLVECYRGGGNLDNPSGWAFASGPAGGGRVREPWLVRGIALSYDTPWEAARKARLWRLVWGGIVRWSETPFWDLPRSPEPVGRKDMTRRILHNWLPAKDDATPLRAQVASLLDNSWLADERLFPEVGSLRAPATRSRARVEATRITIALQLYRLEKGTNAVNLSDIAPKYLKELPVDPYSGKSFGYRLTKDEDIPGLGRVVSGHALVWSTGPDGNDHGGKSHGGVLMDSDERWQRDALDLIRIVERRR